MTLAITSSTSSSCSTGRTPASQPRGLDADLAKAQSELANWVHCPSSKTPEGKAKIEEVSARVDAIKGKMKKAEESPQIVAQPAARTVQIYRSQADAAQSCRGKFGSQIGGKLGGSFGYNHGGNFGTGRGNTPAGVLRPGQLPERLRLKV